MPDLITVVFTPPDKAAGKAAFEAACMDMGDKLNPFITQVNSAVTHINGQAAAADDAANDAQTAKGLAEAARDAALAASTAVAADYNPAGVAYTVNDLVWDAPGELYRCILGYTSNATRPKDNATNWVRVNLTPAELSAITSAVAANAAAIETLRDVPSAPKSAPYTLALADRGLSVDTTAGVTVPANAAVDFPDGAVVMVTNVSEASISITPAAGVTLQLAGLGNPGTRTLDKWGVCSLRKIVGNLWLASGAGLR